MQGSYHKNVTKAVIVIIIEYENIFESLERDARDNWQKEKYI